MSQAKSVYMPIELINWIQELADHQSRSFSYILCDELNKAKKREERATNRKPIPIEIKD